MCCLNKYQYLFLLAASLAFFYAAGADTRHVIGFGLAGVMLFAGAVLTYVKARK